MDCSNFLCFLHHPIVWWHAPDVFASTKWAQHNFISLSIIYLADISLHICITLYWVSRSQASNLLSPPPPRMTFRAGLAWLERPQRDRPNLVQLLNKLAIEGRGGKGDWSEWKTDEEFGTLTCSELSAKDWRERFSFSCHGDSIGQCCLWKFPAFLAYLILHHSTPSQSLSKLFPEWNILSKLRIPSETNSKCVVQG